MISKLPKWVEIGAFILALVAGFVNAIGLLSFEHQSVSHLSGTATMLGTSFLGDNLKETLHLFGVLLAFLLGSALAGFLLHGTTLRLGKHYDTALILEAILLTVSLVLLMQGSFYGHFFASAACGLQNALATTYSGAVVRTTHVTGIFTDLGLMIGAVCRGELLDTRKAKLFVLIISGFVAGGVLGAWLYNKFYFQALWLPITICLLIAGVYRFALRDKG
ncbi:YoaK family protein [Pseudoalteromonas piscicida]|uniref:YoaK family protein n=1 Tax=Pseudoalteromonas piscicida TaxID=43662 RepID=UPI0005F9AB57|nr:YoaK family protein [Pseudoalteromonas piscicida]KJY88669.1 membrane protein [Pseudoalteromonas piscicida]